MKRGVNDTEWKIISIERNSVEIELPREYHIYNCDFSQCSTKMLLSEKELERRRSMECECPIRVAPIFCIEHLRVMTVCDVCYSKRQKMSPVKENVMCGAYDCYTVTSLKWSKKCCSKRVRCEHVFCEECTQMGQTLCEYHRGEQE